MVVHPKGGSGGASVPKFFGLRESRESLRIERAEALLSGNQSTLTIEGEVTVPQAHSIFISPVTIQIGNKSFTFKLDRRGVATTPNGTFTVKNASEFGVIYGGMMQFSAKISGAPLPAEVLRSPNSVPTISSPIMVQVGRAQHSATARIAIRE
jgi:hypothetical protein